MELRLLGPVEVLAAGRPVDPGSPRQRCVLAALAVDAGRPVGTQVVIDRPHIDAAAAASLIGGPPSRVRPLLAELTRASLLAEWLPGRYALHDLLRAYATELARRVGGQDECRRAQRRFLDHYLRTVHTAARFLSPHLELFGPAPGVGQ